MPKTRPENAQARHALFATEYAASRSGTKAALAAGYSPATAKEQGYQILSRPDIKGMVAELDAQLTARTNVTKDWVVAQTVHTYGRSLELDNPAAARRTGCHA